MRERDRETEKRHQDSSKETHREAEVHRERDREEHVLRAEVRSQES